MKQEGVIVKLFFCLVSFRDKFLTLSTLYELLNLL